MQGLQVVRPKPARSGEVYLVTDEMRSALRGEFLHERESLKPALRFYSYWLEQEVADLRFEVNRLRIQLKRAKLSGGD
jgi:hypothetical protein